MVFLVTHHIDNGVPENPRNTDTAGPHCLSISFHENMLPLQRQLKEREMRADEEWG